VRKIRDFSLKQVVIGQTPMAMGIYRAINQSAIKPNSFSFLFAVSTGHLVSLANDEHTDLIWITKSEAEELSPIATEDLEIVLAWS
jgi:hypothetical protein